MRSRLALVDADHADAIETLAEALPLLRAIERLNEVANGEITLATCLMLAGETEEAETHLNEGLRIAAKIDHYAIRCHGEAASALLADMQGDSSLAGERYMVALAEPFVANSCWFADVYGQLKTN